MQPALGNRWLSPELLYVAQSQRQPTQQNTPQPAESLIAAAPAYRQYPPDQNKHAAQVQMQQHRSARSASSLRHRIVSVGSGLALLIGSAAFSYLVWSAPAMQWLESMRQPAQHALSRTGAPQAAAPQSPLASSGHPIDMQRQEMLELRNQNNDLATQLRALQARLDPSAIGQIPAPRYGEVRTTAQASAASISLR